MHPTQSRSDDPARGRNRAVDRVMAAVLLPAGMFAPRLGRLVARCGMAKIILSNVCTKSPNYLDLWSTRSEFSGALPVTYVIGIARPAGQVGPGLTEPSTVGRRRPQDSQMAASAGLDALTRGFGRRVRRGGLANGVC